jgi:hypothetical protein
MLRKIPRTTGIRVKVVMRSSSSAGTALRPGLVVDDLPIEGA